MPRFFGGKRVLLVVLVLVSASFLIGAGMAKRVLARGDDYENLRVFTEVLSLVQSNYVEDMENKKLVEGAIKGMLKTLDPHTSYMPPEMYKEMQVETEGQFGGLGIEITIRDDQLTVVSPIEDTPAYRAGLQIRRPHPQDRWGADERHHAPRCRAQDAGPQRHTRHRHHHAGRL